MCGNSEGQAAMATLNCIAIRGVQRRAPTNSQQQRRQLRRTAGAAAVSAPQQRRRRRRQFRLPFVRSALYASRSAWLCCSSACSPYQWRRWRRSHLCCNFPIKLYLVSRPFARVMCCLLPAAAAAAPEAAARRAPTTTTTLLMTTAAAGARRRCCLRSRTSELRVRCACIVNSEPVCLAALRRAAAAAAGADGGGRRRAAPLKFARLAFGSCVCFFSHWSAFALSSRPRRRRRCRRPLRFVVSLRHRTGFLLAIISSLVAACHGLPVV